MGVRLHSLLLQVPYKTVASGWREQVGHKEQVEEDTLQRRNRRAHDVRVT